MPTSKNDNYENRINDIFLSWKLKCKEAGCTPVILISASPQDDGSVQIMTHLPDDVMIRILKLLLSQVENNEHKPVRIITPNPNNIN